MYNPNRLLNFGVFGYTDTRASHVAGKAWENPSELLTTVTKDYFWVCWKSRFHEKDKAFHLHSKYQDVPFYLESSWKTQMVVAGRPFHPTVLKCHHLWMGTVTAEGPSLQSVFITHWQQLFNTETPDKKLQHLHKALNISELLRAAFALWACASWNWV